MSETSSGPDALNDLAYEFAQRYRQGQRPSLTEYTNRYPELAAQIRNLFPALVVMEAFGSVAGSPPAGPEEGAEAERRKLPRQLGEYRLLREIGRGGMGVVYEAVQESLGRHVALKVLPLHSLISPTHRERFEREARAAARLHHSNIVPVFGIGACEGIHYYAMQFIQGQGLDSVLHEVKGLRAGQERKPAPALTISLAEKLLSFPSNERDPGAASGGGPSEPNAGNALAVAATECTTPARGLITSGSSDLTGPSEAAYFRRVAELGVQVADALAYTHRNGIVHRDIKPSNLLLDTQGAVWITDFGLVKEEGSDNLTSPGDFVGTVRYMAPERFDDKCDGRSDLYCLGVTLYEMLTLRPPFEDTARARLTERIRHEEPVRPRKLDPRIPRDLETVVLKAMAKEPGQRYQSAGELAEDLRRFLSDRPIQARRSSLGERTWRWCRRNPAVASLAAFVALLLVGIAAVKSVSVVQLQEQLHRAERAEADRTEQLWEAYLAQAQASRGSGRVGRRFEGLAAIAKAVDIHADLRLRNEAIGLLALPDMRPYKELPEGVPATSTDLAFDSTFEHYACSDSQGNLSIRRLVDDQEVAALPGFGKHAFGLRFSPDGRFLSAFYHQGTGRTWDIHQRRVVSEAGIFDPASRRVAITRPDWVILYELPSGKEVRRLPVGPGKCYCAFSPNGRQLAVSSTQSPNVRMFDVEAGTVVRTLPHAGLLFWQAEGAFLAQINKDGIGIWNTRTWTVQAVLGTPRARFDRVTWNDRGDLLASSGWDDILRLWHPVTGQLLLQRHGARAIQFSRDGSLLAGTFDGLRYQVWRVTPRLAYHLLYAPQSPEGVNQDADFSPDGRLLACARSDGVHLWDLATSRPVAALDTPGTCGGVRFLEDGSLITSTTGGVFRWPVRKTPEASANRLILGPPQLLLSLSPSDRIGLGLCPDGRIAVPVRTRGHIVLLDPYHPDAQVVLPGHSASSGDVATSPDGRWLAASTYWDLPQDKLRVSDVRTGQIAWTLPEKTPGAFSPDGQWLATIGPECRFYEVGSWRPARTLPREAKLGRLTALAFSPDRSTLALASDAQVVRLVELSSGRELATLAAPDVQRPIFKLAFSADGSQLAGVMGDSRVQLWDLRLLRQQLGDMGLDWDAPPFPPVAAGTEAGPLTVTVETGRSSGTEAPSPASR
jgi:serine/threonine protein kinase/WD40 repeat protein